MSAFTGVFDVKRMKEEGNGVVVWGRENNSAVHAIVVIVWPARTLQIAKCLFIFSVAILEKRKFIMNVCILILSALLT